jgi:hypothetical protein
MTDNEIIKALECCMDEMGCTKGCPCFNPKAKGSHCTVAKKLELEKLTLDLINRQQAEIERLQTEKDNLICNYAECQVSNLNEFMQRLEQRLAINTDISNYEYQSIIENISIVYKEMVGDAE